MSLTSYRAAPPRGDGCVGFIVRGCLVSVLCRPGSDLLFRVLGRSTIGAEGFHGRVRDGIGCRPLAMATRPAKNSCKLATPEVLWAHRPEGLRGTRSVLLAWLYLS